MNLELHGIRIYAGSSHIPELLELDQRRFSLLCLVLIEFPEFRGTDACGGTDCKMFNSAE